MLILRTQGVYNDSTHRIDIETDGVLLNPSKTQSEKMDKNMELQPNDGQHRFRLPEKTYKMLNESLTLDVGFFI